MIAKSLNVNQRQDRKQKKIRIIIRIEKFEKENLKHELMNVRGTTHVLKNRY